MIFIDEMPDTENPYNMIIPFSFILRDDAEPEIHCFRDVYDTVKKYECLISEDDLPSVLRNIHKDLKGYAEKLGFTVYDEDADDYLFSFVMDDESSLPEYDTGKSERIKKAYDNLTEYDIRSYLEDGLRVFGTVADGKIVSAAAENLFDTDYDDGIEISTETAEEYKNRGYATANVCALCRDILKSGKKVYYVASHKNLPSVALAEKCGFKRECIFYSYCCYK